MALLLFAAAIMSMATSCDSYEKRMAKFEKAADGFKASLGANATILAEVVDSIAQEIIYVKWVDVDDSWDFVDCEKDDRYGIIEAHNFATGVTMNVMAKWHKKDEYRYYRNSRLINDRLFLNFWDGRYGTAVVYINVRDNSIHDVAFPEEAEISDNQIVLTEMYLIHDSEFMYEIEYGRKQYVISTDLTDAEYETAAKVRAEDIEKIEKTALEEDKRQRQKSRFIGRYTIQGGDWDCPIEILSDGRVLLISHVIVTGEEIPKYIGDINIISENAFTIINSPYNVSLCYNGTPIYVMRNGVERNIAWTSRDGLKASSLVFDIAENRAYRGVQDYRNRDIGEVEYVKFTR